MGWCTIQHFDNTSWWDMARTIIYVHVEMVLFSMNNMLVMLLLYILLCVFIGVLFEHFWSICLCKHRSLYYIQSSHTKTNTYKKRIFYDVSQKRKIRLHIHTRIIVISGCVWNRFLYIKICRHRIRLNIYQDFVPILYFTMTICQKIGTKTVLNCKFYRPSTRNPNTLYTRNSL